MLNNSHVKHLEENLLHSRSLCVWGGVVGGFGGTAFMFCTSVSHLHLFLSLHSSLAVFFSFLFSFFFILQVWRRGCKKVFQTAQGDLKKKCATLKNQPNHTGFDIFVAKKINPYIVGKTFPFPG